jgi:hypothetical protein
LRHLFPTRPPRSPCGASRSADTAAFFGECGWSLVTLHYSILVLPPTLRAVRGAAPACGLRSIAFGLAGFQQPRFGLSTAEVYAVFVQRRERLCVLSHQRDCNLPRCAFPVVPMAFGHRNATHRMPFTSRATRPIFASRVVLPPHVPLDLCAALACEARTARTTLSDIRWRAGCARPDGTTRFLFADPCSHRLSPPAGELTFFALRSRPG